PTLREVLSRRSNPPVCLYNYYLYLRDREQTQHYLDFWLDVTAHENRCRIYCKNIIRSSRRMTATSTLTAQNTSAMLHPPPLPPPSHPAKKPVSREDIQRSARKIYRRYMVAGARRELHFPESIRHPIVQALEVEHRDDPEVFMEAKEYVFRLMEQCYFPRFIKERSEHNISEKQATFRLVAGLMLLFIGFTVEFSLIFL
ncbi:RGS domain-containing protein, partial [Syncephalis pseudoplumigaleata]